MKYSSLTIKNENNLVFGKAPHSVKCGNDLIIGDGLVFPEINFTLPEMEISEKSWDVILRIYSEIIDTILKRAKILKIPGIVIEFEQLPPMTTNPQLGGEITQIIKSKLNACDIPNALRVTVVDLRDGERPPKLRYGQNWEKMKQAFIIAAQAGADILSIESVGGKEVHDQALLYADLNGIVGSLGVLAYNDMCWLWKQINEIAVKYNVIAGGDTACGFANTAMQLAGKNMIPSILAAIDRIASIPRSLAAYEHGAKGPSKDCAYEGPFIKAIAGIPISMEGKSASCAHFSHMGNIAAAMADLWSNESVQNIRLLSGFAPEVYLETLAYDCRLMNQAVKNGEVLKLRDWLIESDAALNVEAFILKPQHIFSIANEVIKYADGYSQTKYAVIKGLKLIKQGIEKNSIMMSEGEKVWLNNFEIELGNIADTEDQAMEYLERNYGNSFLSNSYEIN